MQRVSNIILKKVLLNCSHPYLSIVNYIQDTLSSRELGLAAVKPLGQVHAQGFLQTRV